MAKLLVPATVPCLRSPMPSGDSPRPQLVLPEMLAHMLSLIEIPFPASSLIPFRFPARGAATVLFWTLARTVPEASRAVTRMPLPSVAEMVLFVIVTSRLGVSVAASVALVPAPIPCAPAWLLATILLLLIVAVTFANPNDPTEIAVPIELVIGLATVPLFEMSKLPWPRPLTAVTIAKVPNFGLPVS